MQPIAPNTLMWLDGRGGGSFQPFSPGITVDPPDQGMAWVHLDRSSEQAHDWLRRCSGLDEVVVEALLAEETRPRCVAMPGGTLLVLRGVNLNPGAEREDMVALRLFIGQGRVVSSRRRRLMSLDDLRDSLAQGRGPVDAGEFVVDVVHYLVTRIADAVGAVEDRVDLLQARVLDVEDKTLRGELSHLRQEIIVLRRYLAPQRDALNQLYHGRVDWLSGGQLQQLREETDRVTRLVEDLDAARERAAVTAEELASRLSDQLNNRMYVLTVVAGIFLPLGFVTGLLGINVGGMPLADSPWGFALVTAVLLAVGLAEVLFFRWRRWV